MLGKSYMARQILLQSVKQVQYLNAVPHAARDTMKEGEVYIYIYIWPKEPFVESTAACCQSSTHQLNPPVDSVDLGHRPLQSPNLSAHHFRVCTAHLVRMCDHVRHFNVAKNS